MAENKEKSTDKKDDGKGRKTLSLGGKLSLKNPPAARGSDGGSGTVTVEVRREPQQ